MSDKLRIVSKGTSDSTEVTFNGEPVMASAVDIRLRAREIVEADVTLLAPELDIETDNVKYSTHRPWLNWFTGGVIVGIGFAVVMWLIFFWGNITGTPSTDWIQK